MGRESKDVGCFGLSEGEMHVTHEGLLQYRSKNGEWKERWFILDSAKPALVKCGAVTHQPSRSIGSVLGDGVMIADIRPLPKDMISSSDLDRATATGGADDTAVYGFEVSMPSGATFTFRTASKKDQDVWLVAIGKTSSGFSSGVVERLAVRQLLAGKYSLVRELGRGASGIVSLYTWQGKPFAIKKFVPQKTKGVLDRRAVPSITGKRPSVKMSGPNSVPDDVRREVALLKKASNLPHVIRLHDVILDTQHREYYLVMEYLGGGTIAEWDSSRRSYVSSKVKSAAAGNASLLDESTVRAYMTCLVLAVQGLHVNHLSHRDIKPENLLANETHTLCKLGDLGVAHYFKEENGELRDEEDVEAMELWDINQSVSKPPSPCSSEPQSPTNNVESNKPKPQLRGLVNSTKGTYQFLPPEAMTGDAFCAFKADIWAIGVTMYALLFGSLPFYSPDVVELFEKIEKDPLEFPARCQDEDAKDLLRSILEKDPEKRISLEGILHHRWTHRNVNAKSLRQQVRAMKEAPALSVEDHEVGSAVSVHHSLFAKVMATVHHHHGSEYDEKGVSSPSTGVDSAPHGTSNGDRAKPIDTTQVVIPEWFQPFRVLVASQMHYDWCRSKSLAGWKYGDVRDDAHLIHPCLTPLRALDADSRDRNLAAVDETMKCVVALGCRFKYNRPAKLKTPEVPFQLDRVYMSWDLLMLVDLLAENSHEAWAESYTANGWQYGPQFDEDTKTHPSLRPYMSLEEDDKALTREGVASVLKSCVYLGFTISCSHRDKRA